MTTSTSTSQITKDLGKALSPYIQHQGSCLFIYGTHGYGVYVLCIQSFGHDGTLASEAPFYKKRADLGDHPRTTACQSLTDYFGRHLTYKTRSILLHSGLPEFWDGSNGTTYYAVHGLTLGENALDHAIREFNVSKRAMEDRIQLDWVHFNRLDQTRFPEGLVAFLRSQRASRWDVGPSCA